MTYEELHTLRDTDENRILKYFDLPSDVSDCWIWKGTKNRKGYGQFRLHNKLRVVTRVMYFNYKGEGFNSDIQICHSCDNPSCINPSHLFVGTNQENQIDSVIKGRHSKSRLTHCPKGHPYSQENTYFKPNTRWRVCRKCQRHRGLLKSKYRRVANEEVS